MRVPQYIPVKLHATIEEENNGFRKWKISSKYLRRFHLPNEIQVISIEVHFKRRKLLVVSIYRPPDQKLAYFLSSITDLLDHYLKNYEDFIVIGDFNENETSPALDSFLDESVKTLSKVKLVLNLWKDHAFT